MDSNGSRSRRKLSRVNYAEDFNNEDELGIEEASSTTATAAANSSRVASSEVLSANKTNSSSPSSSSSSFSSSPVSTVSAKLKRKSSKETSPLSNDNFPLNWQPKLRAGESISQVMDFEDATMKNGIVTLANGETLAPDGELLLALIDTIIFSSLTRSYLYT